jgi:hypothetical protein
MNKIVIICHPNVCFSVTKDPDLPLSADYPEQNVSEVFKTRQEADACAKHLQDEAGGPDKAHIVVHDLTKSS